MKSRKSKRKLPVSLVWAKSPRRSAPVGGVGDCGGLNGQRPASGESEADFGELCFVEVWEELAF